MESFALIAGHMAGDYLLQNDWMAQGKKKSSLPCAVHCAIYTACIWAVTLWPWWAIAITFALHFAQDRTQFIRWYMGCVGQSQFAQPPMAPWSMIAVDNSFHFVVLALTWWAVRGLA